MFDFDVVRKIWRTIKYDVLQKGKLGKSEKKKFKFIGERSEIFKPYFQLSGCDKVVIGDDVTILKNCRIAVFGENKQEVISIGNRCYIAFSFTALASSTGKITIGDDVLIASNVLISNENHGIDPESTAPYMEQKLTSSDVIIGDGCWIGEKACILPGVSVGKKCVIGAGAVVTKSVPDFCIVAGNPAKIIKKYSFESHTWEKV